MTFLRISVSSFFSHTHVIPLLGELIKHLGGDRHQIVLLLLFDMLVELRGAATHMGDGNVLGSPVLPGQECLVQLVDQRGGGS